MINTPKQLEYWLNTALDNLSTAEYLIKGNKLVEGLFFCHLSIEKIIKAHIVKYTNNIPPKSHDLFYLANKSGLQLTDEQNEFMQILMKYLLEGRYPEYQPKPPSIEKTNDYLCKTKELLECLKLTL